MFGLLRADYDFAARLDSEGGGSAPGETVRAADAAPKGVSAAGAGAPVVVTPMAEEGVAPAPASLEAAAPMPAPPATEDETVVGSESDLELDLECSVCAEPFDVKERAPMVLPCSGSHEICALCVVALRDRFGGDDGAFHCPSCREPILPCFPINKNRGLMAALRLNERLARRRR